MKQILFTLFLINFSISLYAQQPTITSSVSANLLVCPGALVDYTLNMPSGYSFCSATWSIKNGGVGSFFNNVTTGSNVKITWNEQKPNKVEIEVTVKFRPTSGGSCASPEETVLTFTHILRSVFQESFTNVGSPVNVPYCASQPVVTLGVNTMYIKNTGGADQPPLAEVERYQWILPAGWKQVGTGNTGTIHTTISTIQVEPSNDCTSGGEVKVRGIAGGATQCVGLPFSLSNQATIVLNRTPAFTVTPPSGYTGQQCGDRNPVVFTVAPLSCVSTYNWTYPSGWSGPAQTTTNSVSVVPNDTGGNVTVTVNTGTCNISKSYSVIYTNPGLSTPTFTSGSAQQLCSNSSGTVSVNPVEEAASYSWYVTGGTMYVNGVLTSSSNPLVTTTPTVTVSSPIVTGPGYAVSLIVKANRQNPVCAGSNGQMRSILVGGYAFEATYNNGQPAAHMPYPTPLMTPDDPRVPITYNPVCAEAATYVIISGNNGMWEKISPHTYIDWGEIMNNDMFFTLPTAGITARFRLTWDDGCGTTLVEDFYFRSNNCTYGLLAEGESCTQYLVSPNPASSIVNIVVPDDALACDMIETTEEEHNELIIESVSLVDISDGREKYAQRFSGKTKTAALDVSNLKKGLYILRVSGGKRIEDHRIIVE